MEVGEGTAGAVERIGITSQAGAVAGEAFFGCCRELPGLAGKQTTHLCFI